ncbi:MAG TPA: hypothetical protein EYG57_19280 [Planctomycetes bacterium]|nr:hypothetical protein [Planctomycetota bacterium]
MKGPIITQRLSDSWSFTWCLRNDNYRLPDDLYIGVFWLARFKKTTATRTALNPTTATLANLGALPPKLTLKELDPLVLSLDRDPLSALGYATAAGPSDRASYGTMLQLVQ